ncbi:MAG: FAD-binding and (Fe-S)-binding domain-containing protein [Arachnia sp.]
MDSVEPPVERDTRAISRLAMAHDASHFLLTPAEIARPTDVTEVAALIADAARRRRPLTFRSGGTSLTGQAVTSGTLVDVRRHFRHIEVLDEGMRVRAGAGATLAAVNARLAPFGRRLGPDPTSAIACTIGGIIANNSGGILSGIAQNSYHTVESMVFALPSGRVVDTADPAADITLRLEETELVGGLHMLRKRLRTNPDSIREINRLFAMKNTMGYGLNSLLEFHRPVDIIAHLLVGSEGTLGFVSEATFRTVPLAAHGAAVLLLFPHLQAAAAASAQLLDVPLEAVELMDVASLRVLQHHRTSPTFLREAYLTTQAALLIELHDADQDRLLGRIATVKPLLRGLGPIATTGIVTDPRARRSLGELRRGLYARVAGARPSGTTTLMEDVSVPLDRFAETLAALDALFYKHGYGIPNVPLFAHAKDGNIHFLLSEDFSQPSGLLRYRKFTRDLVRTVLDRGGVLKAEHGTGRAMAPFVRAQYGDELFEVIRAIKFLFDPAGVLNPGVIISDDPDEHLRNLKLMPRIEPEVDGCIECGYCEAGCPSRDLTLTPRQRIVLRRELAARRDDEDLVAQVEGDYAYQAVETCAADGMCAVACPLGLDTGELVRRQRAEAAGTMERAAWTAAARNWGVLTRAGSAALTAAKATGPLAAVATRLGRRVAGEDIVPAYTRGLPRGSGLSRKPRRKDRGAPGVAAYFPSCLQTMLRSDGEGVFAAFRELCLRAGVRVTLLPANDLCCGAPWSAKGMPDGLAVMRRKVLDAIAPIGQVPIVTDAASCTQALRRLIDGRDAPVVDIVAFAATELLPRLTVTHRLDSLALHPTCASTELGLNDALLRVARFIADDVVVPASWSCCGFAGDRGLLHPELTAAATAPMADELAGRTFAAYASLNRTCEVGMTQATGHPYRHIVELLAVATRPAEGRAQGSP